MEAKKVCSEMPVLVCALPAPESSALPMLVGCAMAEEDEEGDAMAVLVAENRVFRGLRTEGTLKALDSIDL